MNDRFKKWERWLSVIETEIGNLYRYKHIFGEVQEIIKNNPNIQKPSSFYEFLGSSYVALILMGIRRQLKSDKQSISFARLLQEIIDTPEVLSRHRFVSLYKGSVVEHHADRDFDKFAGKNKAYINPIMVQKDIDELKKQGLKLEDFADKKIAHTDKRAPKNIPIFNDIDNCIETMGKLLKKYILIFRATALLSVLPVYQYDWKAIFYEPWLLKELEFRGHHT